MATYDLLMIAILVGLTLYGYFKGMAWQIAYIASFVASYFIANQFADQMAPWFTQQFGLPAPTNKFAAWGVIYAGASLGVWMIFRIVRGGIDKVKMEGFDHQMGAILGFGRGALWCVGVTFLLMTVLPTPQAFKQQIVSSKSGYYIASVIDKSPKVFPPEVHQVIGPYLQQLGNELNQPTPSPNAFPSGGWPTQSSQVPTQSAPSWGQSTQQTSAAAPGWPSSQPSAAAGWPQAGNAAPAQPSASDFGWPAAGATQQPPSAPAQPVSWPKWD